MVKMPIKHIGIIIGCVILITVGILMFYGLQECLILNHKNLLRLINYIKNSMPQSEKIEVEMDYEYVSMFTIDDLGKIEQVYSIVMSMNYSFCLVF